MESISNISYFRNYYGRPLFRFFTATESAAVGVILVLILFLRRQLTLEMLKNSIWDAIKTVGALYLLLSEQQYLMF